MGVFSKLVGFVVALTIAAFVLRGLERFFPARSASGAPIRTKLFARERLTDVAHIALNQVVTRPILRGLTLGVVIAFVVVFRLPRDPSHLFDVWHRDARLTHLPLAVQIPLALLFADLVGYWMHRAFHFGALWRFHAVHHSSRALDWLAGARNHPVAEALTSMTTLGALLVAGFDPRVLALTAPLGLFAILLHANVSWGKSFVRYVIVTPLVHRWHHARLDALPEEMRARGVTGVNFAGLLPIWDLIFGTFYAPAHGPEAFGTGDGDDDAVPPRFFAQLAFPFRRRYRRL